FNSVFEIGGVGLVKKTPQRGEDPLRVIPWVTPRSTANPVRGRFGSKPGARLETKGANGHWQRRSVENRWTSVRYSAIASTRTVGKLPASTTIPIGGSISTGR